MRVFLTKGVVKFTRQERISAGSLREAVDRANRGLVDADLGGSLIKQRVARPGQGRSGGFRMIVAIRTATRAVILYGFAKSDRENIEHDDLGALQTIGLNWLAADERSISQAINDGTLKEIDYDDEKS
ncbi:type II toxin-antitoxin system RelE/ParE family toxin [Acidisoma cladoniae]|uniref:type II toxin-antitoxin system RelE/ParE family toxin n=1 Tax=Acidisoma cladoniae TaxID=3040935 RepID=UPI0025518855|nr:type II toxin-antitoxin system RelE/ParE family toxin [Acidisoma sp. PAMC 29798]